jgi:hypothetical protein
VHAEFDHAVACADVNAGAGQLLATVVVELYDETSAFGRRVRLAHNCTSPLYVRAVEPRTRARLHAWC